METLSAVHHSNTFSKSHYSPHFDQPPQHQTSKTIKEDSTTSSSVPEISYISGTPIILSPPCDHFASTFDFVRNLFSAEDGKVDLMKSRVDGQLVVFKELIGADEITVRCELDLFMSMKGLHHTIPLLGWFRKPKSISENASIPSQSDIGDSQDFVYQPLNNVPPFEDSEYHQKNNGNFVLIMPFIKDSRPTSSAEIRTYMHQLLQSIAYIHSIGIIHRNLKRKNVLYDKEKNQFFMIDFGDATFHHENSWYEDVGNWKYMAPEQSTHYYAHPADVWSAGIIMAELIFGVNHVIRVYNRQEFLHRLHQFQSGKLKENPWKSWLLEQKREHLTQDGTIDLSKCHHVVLDLLDRMTRVDPRERISAVEALQHPYFVNSSD